MLKIITAVFGGIIILSGIDLAHAAGRTFYLEGPLFAWLPPSLAIIGISMQIMAVFKKKPFWLLPGVAAVVAGAIIERDITLLAGDIFVAACLWGCLKI